MQQAAPASDRPLPNPAPADELLPQQFGKYTLLSRLTGGGMAEVFLALQRSVAGFEKLVVVKRVLPAMNNDQAFVDRLLHEARVAATLSHPNIVQTFDAGLIDGQYFISMEHIHGEDLHAILRAAKKKQGEVPLEHVITIMIGVCAGLSYMHEKRDLGGLPLGIVHRDISTRNIVVSFNGDVKIVDFGVAKSKLETTDDPKEPQLVGKIPYMAPEQVIGGDLDRRTDLFAAGVILFEATTGKRLFRAANDIATLLMIRDGEYPWPSQVKPGYPMALEHIVMRALQKKPQDRYQSARELQTDLEQFARQANLPVSSMALVAWMQTLFAEHLARQKETLQGVKQLVNVIAAEQKRWETEMAVGRASMLSIQASSGQTATNTAAATVLPPQQPRLSLGSSVVPAASALALVGGFVYMQHEMSLRQAEILKMYRDEQELRQQRPPAPASAKGALEIASKPAGCAIWLNGDLLPEVTPTKLDNLPLGRELHVKLTKDGFETYRTSVRLGEDAPFKEVVVDMKKSTVTVALRVEPAAAVWVDGKMWKGDRSKIEGLSPGEEHRIVIAATGYASKTLNVTGQAGETKSFSIQLVKVDNEPR
jgi:serine/threonine-protein kinase